MPELDQKQLTPGNGQPLLDRPEEERLRAEVEDLKRQLDEERKKSEKHDEHKPVRPKTRTLWMIGLALIAVLLLAFFIGWLPKHKQEEQLAREAQQQAATLPEVHVVKVKRSPKNTQLNLPGNIEAIEDAPILARSDGYLKARYVDIGDRVKKGQVLAEVAAPDLDQQVKQGRAQLLQSQAAIKQANSSLEQAKANQALAKVTAARYANLFNRGAVARQDNDQYQTNYQANTANVNALNEAVAAAQRNEQAAQANLNRLLELQGFEKLRAPFDGVVTYRNIDVGALISTGTTLLFRVAQINRLRTYIYVPQTNAPTVQVGQPAYLTCLEFPGRRFQGIVTRSARALDPATRTMVTEVQVPNPDGTLLPGMFVEVDLNNQRENPPILIPGESLLVEASGTQVAVVNPMNDQQQGQQQQKQKVYQIHMQPVTVGRDYGAQTEILTGLQGGELVVENPNDDVQEGAKVHAQMSRFNPEQNQGQAQGSKGRATTDQLQPKPGGQKVPKQPSKENERRGPGF